MTPAQQAPVKAKPGRKPGRKPKNEEPKEEQASALLPALVASQEESFREKVSDNAGSSVPENPAETEDGTQDIADVGGMSEATVEREERPVQKGVQKPSAAAARYKTVARIILYFGQGENLHAAESAADS